MVAVKKPETKNLIDICLSLEDFQKLHMSEIKDAGWVEVEFRGDIIGACKTEDLKELNLNNHMNTDFVRLRPYGETEFKNIFEYPLFSRRKPQLVSVETLNTDFEAIYLLKNGQKNGPYGIHDLQMMMRTREILPTDLVSIDNGQHYIKLFQVEGFDRRALKTNHELPEGLDEELVLRAKEDNILPSTDSDTDAIASLAYLGQIKAGKLNDRNQVEKREQEIKESYTNYSKLFFGIFATALIYTAFQMKSFFPLNLLSVKKPIGEQAEVLTPVGVPFEANSSENTNENVQNSPRSNYKFENSNFQNRQINSVIPRKVKSFDQSNTFRRSQVGDSQNDTTTQFIEPVESYYDDNPAPIELDPVQADVSKETFEAEEGSIKPQESSGLFDQNVAN